MSKDTQWYKDAVIYELHVRSFNDSSGDGIGDFKGLKEKLGYFEELGVTALWLLPFYPSPLRDDGYDIADYYSINPSYGTMEDFKEFLDEAHRRKLKVITELVINHTSDQNAWFQRARRAPKGSPERDFYVWSDTPEKFKEARIIFKDFEPSNWAWDSVAQSYYWHRFFSHQPDLNFDNPAVREAVFKVLDYWFDLGVDGLRLDAIPYLFEREGTSCENLPETHAYLKDLRKHVDEHYPGRMLLAEANQWPEDSVAYFGKGDSCHMSFHFPLMPRLFMGLQMEDRFPIIDILEQTPEIPASCQWAIFLRNHDELTLEMVTDEERDYMYRLYAEDPQARINLGIRRRLAPLLNNNRRQIELINSLLFSLPGTPIIYYGDEIGMGDNFYLGDRNGVRTPMQWSADRNAGFSRTNPQQLFLPVIIDPEFHYEAVNVDMQMKNLSSLFWFMRRQIDLRKRHKAFSHGTIEFLRTPNAKVLAFLRKYEDENILVVANLSRFSQAVNVDLSAYQDCKIIELFGGDEFVKIGDGNVSFTIGPRGFYWLDLKSVKAKKNSAEALGIPTINLASQWSQELTETLESVVLPRYLPSCRWFGQKQRLLRAVNILENIPDKNDALHVLLVELVFSEGDVVVQSMPLLIGSEEEGDPGSGSGIVARFDDGKVLWDATHSNAGREKLWQLIANGETWRSFGGSVRGWQLGELKREDTPTSKVLGGEQSNTAIGYDNKYLLKYFRKFEEGPHPDAEILRVLGEKGFPHVPRYVGEIRLRLENDEGVGALLTTFVKNQGDGWHHMLDAAGRFFEEALSIEIPAETEGEVATLVDKAMLQRVRQLGERTAALHCCLASIYEKPEFAPEPFTGLYQRSLYQSMRNSLRRTETAVTNQLNLLEIDVRQKAMNWLAATPRILALYQKLLSRRITAAKTRVHGDYHLGQVLNTGNDFVILDFEGEPRRSLGERLLKRSPLVDVAGMLRSFDYAVETVLGKQKAEDIARLRPWAAGWLDIVSATFLNGYGYCTEAKAGDFLPTEPEDFNLLLLAFQLDKAVYEIGYELAYRPDHLAIPMGAAGRLLAAGDGETKPVQEPEPETAVVH